MDEIIRFEGKIRKTAKCQTNITVPKHLAEALAADQPVLVLICRRENQQIKEDPENANKAQA